MRRNYHFNYLRFPASAAALCLTLNMMAAPVSPDEALMEARDFLMRPHAGRMAAPAMAPQLEMAYRAAEADEPLFYIFNHDSGFVIVAADDRLPEILGYSDNGAFDESRIPDNFRWWLDEYSKEISNWLPTAQEVKSDDGRTVRRAAKDRAPIEPMLTTRWDQTTPYNDDCPLYAPGMRSVTGCVATAMAQILNYHEWPLKPEGSHGGVDFSSTTYDWRNMLDVYEAGKYSSAQAAAVAKLMYQCGVAVDMQYSPWASGAYDNDVQVALRKYFKYNPELKMVLKDYTPQTTWNNMVYAELEAGRPVYYSGSSSQGGHAFVCDGYSENEFFHFNWGWSGYQDGYFRLTALNPASGGAGSYEGGYNSGQTIMTGVSPNKTGATAPEQIMVVASGGLFYDSGEKFEIRQDPDGFNLIYNPMAYTETVKLAMKYESAENPDFAPKYTDMGSVTLPKWQGIQEMEAKAPSLPDGVYKVTVVFSSDQGKSWEPVLIPLGRQNYVRLTVSGGKATYENAGPDDSNKANLIINMPETTPVIYGNASIAFRLPMLNVGQGDYMGDMGITLVDKNDEFGDVLSIMDAAPVAGRSFNEWEAVSPDHLNAGEYLMYVQDDDANMLIDGVTVKVVEGDFPTVDDSDEVKFSELSPNFMTSGMENPIYFTATSISIFEESRTVGFTVLDAETLQKVKDLPGTYKVTVPANYDGRLTIAPRDLGLDPGYYMWYVTDGNGKALSSPAPLIVNSQPLTENGVTYVVTDEKNRKAIITAPLSGGYEGAVEVPASIADYNVTALRADAFAFASATAVTLPESITSLPDGAFYSDYQLRSLTLNAPELVTTGASTFTPANAARCWLVTPDELAIPYHESDVWKDFQMTCWQLTLEDVEITSGWPTDPATGELYAPYYVNCFTPIELHLKAADGKNVLVLVSHNGEWVEYHTIDPTVTTVTLPALGMRGSGRFSAWATDDEVGVDTVDADTDSAPAAVFSIDGRLILRDASAEQIRALEPGIYIIGGRKQVVR